MTQLFSFFKRNPAEAIADPLAERAGQLKQLKVESLVRAKAEAKAEGRMPTLTDYFVACEQLGEERAAWLAERQIAWNVKAYVDLSGLTIDGFLHRPEDLNPPAEIRQKASAYAIGLAKHQNRKPSTLDYVMAVRRELYAQFPPRKAA